MIEQNIKKSDKHIEYFVLTIQNSEEKDQFEAKS